MNHTRFRHTKAPIKILMTALSLSLLSCSTMNKSVLLGTGIGMVAGGLLGSSTVQNGDESERQRGTLTGAAIGGALGGLIGYSAHKQNEKKLQSLPDIKGFGKDPKVPSVTMPEVRRVWVPDKIDGNKYETGHWIYILDKTSTWSQSDDR